MHYTESSVKVGTVDGSSRSYEISIDLTSQPHPLKYGTTLAKIPTDKLPFQDSECLAHSNTGDVYHMNITAAGDISIAGRHDSSRNLLSITPNADAKLELTQQLVFGRMEAEATAVGIANSTAAGHSSILLATTSQDDIGDRAYLSFWLNFSKYFRSVAGHVKLTRTEFAKSRVQALFKATFVYDHDRSKVIDEDARAGVTQSVSYPETKTLIDAAVHLNSGTIDYPLLTDDDMVLCIAGGIVDVFSITSPDQEAGLSTFLDYNKALFKCITAAYSSTGGNLFNSFIQSGGPFVNTTFQSSSPAAGPHQFYQVKLTILKRIALYAARWAQSNSELTAGSELSQLRSLCSSPYTYYNMNTSGELATILYGLGLVDTSGAIDPSYEGTGSGNPVDFMEIMGIAHYYGQVKGSDYSNSAAAVDAFSTYVETILSELRTSNITMSHSYIREGRALVAALKLRDSYQSDSRGLQEIVDLCGDLAGSVGSIDPENVYTHRMPPIIPTKLTFRFTSSGTNS